MRRRRVEFPVNRQQLQARTVPELVNTAWPTHVSATGDHGYRGARRPSVRDAALRIGSVRKRLW